VESHHPYLIVPHGIVKTFIIFLETLLLQLKVPEIKLVIAMTHQDTSFVEADGVSVGCAIGNLGRVKSP
jgi:hypothetical protein